MVNCVTNTDEQVTEMFPTPALEGEGGFLGLRMPVSLFGVVCIRPLTLELHSFMECEHRIFIATEMWGV